MDFGRAIYEHFRFGTHDSAGAQSLRKTYDVMLKETPESVRAQARIQSEMRNQKLEMQNMKTEIAELKKQLKEKDG